MEMGSRKGRLGLLEKEKNWRGNEIEEKRLEKLIELWYSEGERCENLGSNCLEYQENYAFYKCAVDFLLELIKETKEK